MPHKDDESKSQRMYVMTYNVNHLVDAFMNTLPPDARKQVLRQLQNRDERMLLNSSAQFMQMALMESVMNLQIDEVEHTRTQSLAIMSWFQRMAYHSDLFTTSQERYLNEFPGAFDENAVAAEAEAETESQVIQ